MLLILPIKKFFLLLIVLFFVSSLTVVGQRKIKVNTNQVRVEYHRANGKINGSYKSYYLNGKKKTKGNFRDNYRIGKWTLWDSMGNKVTERYYKSPFEYDQLFPKKSSKGAVTTAVKLEYVIENNDKGYIEYFKVKEEQIVWYKRFERKVEGADNPILFKDDFLLRTLLTLASNSKIEAYKTNNFQENFENFSNDNKEVKLLYYKIKEDWFFDRERSVMEARIIGICPVVQVENKAVDLCWLYYPELREHLAKEYVVSDKTPEYIKSLDDLFFYRFFSASIYHEYGLNDKAFESDKDSEQAEINLIESEHSIWFNMATN